MAATRSARIHLHRLALAPLLGASLLAGASTVPAAAAPAALAAVPDAAPAPAVRDAAPAAVAAASTTLPAYSYSVRLIDSTLAYRMRYTWRSGCPVPLADLRYLRMTYYGFDGAAHTGEMVVHYKSAWPVAGVFRRLYESRFPIQRMRLVDDYYGSDTASMDANNTSGFNCRKKTGGTSWSVHSYGKAIDVNPVQNPYVSGSTVEPEAGRAYLTRWPLQKGMVNWTVRDSFADIGWKWGGNWTSLKDYMHFSSTGY